MIAPPVFSRPALSTSNAKRIAIPPSGSFPKLDNNTNYILDLPQTVRTGGIKIQGGANIVIVGGYLSTKSGEAMPNIIFGDGKDDRTIWVEGLLIDGAGGGMSDAFHMQCPKSHVRLYNNRVDGLNGALSKTHADGIQNLGCRSLSVRKLTCRSHYNNVYMRRENDPVGNPVGPSYFAKCNMGGYRVNPQATGSDPKHTLRAISLGTQGIPPGDPTQDVQKNLTGSVWLYQYWSNLEAEAGVTKDQQVYPHAASRMVASCRAEISADGTYVDWPVWRTNSYPPSGETRPSTPGTMGSGDAQVYGYVKFGIPSTGDYVKESVVGLNYPRL